MTNITSTAASLALVLSQKERTSPCNVSVIVFCSFAICLISFFYLYLFAPLLFCLQYDQQSCVLYAYRHILQVSFIPATVFNSIAFWPFLRNFITIFLLFYSRDYNFQGIFIVWQTKPPITYIKLYARRIFLMFFIHWTDLIH